MKVLLVLILIVQSSLAFSGDEGVLQRFEPPPVMTSDENVDEQLLVVVNVLFDSVIDSLRQFTLDSGLDPMPLPDIHEGFRVGLLLLAISGDITMTNGFLKDFSTLRRDGDATVEYRKKQMDVHFVIGFEDLIMTYDYKAKLLHIGPKGGIIGKIKDMTMEIDLSLNTETNEATLTNLQITHTGNLDLKFTGTIIVDLVLNTLSDVITLLFKSVIVNVIEENVREAINEALNNNVAFKEHRRELNQVVMAMESLTNLKND